MYLVASVVSVVVLAVFGVEAQYPNYPPPPPPPPPPHQGSSPHQSYGADAGRYDGAHGGHGAAAAGSARSYGSGSGSSDDSYQTETKYYYGGKYQGSCSTDGLYYFDDTMFVICSNGYPHEQPCPPGTKTSGSPKYQAGYYYGYTDLCSVNLVDYGYGPEYYAPKGYPVAGDGYEDKATGYGAHDKASVKETYPSKAREYGSYEPSGSGHKDAYQKDNRIPYSDTKNAYPARGAYPPADSYSPKYKDAYSPAKAPYEATPEKKYR